MDKTIYSERYQAFSHLLKSTRESLGISQAELASRLSETQSFVSKCERGERRLDVVELSIWCAAMGVSLSDFSARLDKVLPKKPRRA
jgi:transcriptional regulator with XRE-family HTH domain